VSGEVLERGRVYLAVPDNCVAVALGGTLGGCSPQHLIYGNSLADSVPCAL
jgi:hypothetical protein